MTPPERLAEVRTQLQAGQQPDPITVRTFLEWFGAKKRGFWIVKSIRSALDEADLITVPDFEGAYIDAAILFQLKPVVAEGHVTLPALQVQGTGTVEPPPTIDTPAAPILPTYLGGSVADPTYRIGKLKAANTPPLSVNPQAPVIEAVTQMLLHDYSQLPVMPNERVVRGIISWQSIGSRAALGTLGDTVSDCMDEGVVVSADASLFEALPAIVEREYVLVRGAENRITGIVTTTDLSLQFQQLAEPFLLLGEIENHIRRLIDGKFTTEEVKAACAPEDTDREVNSVADLTFGEYVRLLEKPAMWEKTGLSIDRALFVKRLDAVREIRNDVMHFDPDGVGKEELLELRQFAQFLQTLQELGAT